MDVLAEVLKALRAQGAVFLCSDFTAPWGIVSPPANEVARMLALPGGDCVEFHVVAAGSCWVRVHDQPPVEARAGDIVILPRGDEHTLASSPAARTIPVERIVPAGDARPGRVLRLHHGGGGDTTRILCGYLHCESRFEPLLESLPPLLHVRTCQGGTVVSPAGTKPAPAVGGNGKPTATGLLEPAGAWLESSLQYIITEAVSPNGGDAAVLSRFTELMFVEVLRRYLAEAPAEAGGWLRGVHDPHIGLALQLLHAEPARDWTVEELARHAGVSRSGFAARFAALIGRTPIRYLTEWRMKLAQGLLRNATLNMKQVAARVGYDSEFAFNRAFKRYAGAPPATWRKRNTLLSCMHLFLPAFSNFAADACGFF